MIRQVQPQDRRRVLSTLPNLFCCITRTLQGCKEVISAPCMWNSVLHTRKLSKWDISHLLLNATSLQASWSDFTICAQTVYAWPLLVIHDSKALHLASPVACDTSPSVWVSVYPRQAGRQGRLVSKVTTLPWPGWRKWSRCSRQSRAKESLRGVGWSAANNGSVL